MKEEGIKIYPYKITFYLTPNYTPGDTFTTKDLIYRINKDGIIYRITKGKIIIRVSAESIKKVE